MSNFATSEIEEKARSVVEVRIELPKKATLMPILMLTTGLGW